MLETFQILLTSLQPTDRLQMHFIRPIVDSKCSGPGKGPGSRGIVCDTPRAKQLNRTVRNRLITPGDRYLNHRDLLASRFIAYRIEQVRRLLHQ